MLKKGGNIFYKGLPIHKEHPSGMYTFFSDKRKRFIKSDDLNNLKKQIDKEGQMAKGGKVGKYNVLMELYDLRNDGVKNVYLNGFKESVGYVIQLKLDDSEIKKVDEMSYITLYAKGGTLKKGDKISARFKGSELMSEMESGYGETVDGTIVKVTKQGTTTRYHLEFENGQSMLVPDFVANQYLHKKEYAKGGKTSSIYNVLFQYKGVSPRSGWVQMDNEDIEVDATSSIQAKKLATEKFKAKHPNKEFTIMGVHNLSEKNDFDDMFSKGKMAKGGKMEELKDKYIVEIRVHDDEGDYTEEDYEFDNKEDAFAFARRKGDVHEIYYYPKGTDSNPNRLWGNGGNISGFNYSIGGL